MDYKKIKDWEKVYNENIIDPTAIIYEGVVIGKGNTIGPYCIIGASPEHKNYYGRVEGTVIIGDGNIITGHVTIDAGTSGFTTIGNNCFIMKGVHQGHDSIIGNEVTISCHALIGGHTIINDYCNLGLGCVIHQHQNIAKGCMIGMGTIITKKLITEQFKTYVGNPAKLLGENSKHKKYNDRNL
jgi:UDP-N-acetylglucosamine acyltransferase